MQNYLTELQFACTDLNFHLTIEKIKYEFKVLKIYSKESGDREDEKNSSKFYYINCQKTKYDLTLAEESKNNDNFEFDVAGLEEESKELEIFF